MPPLVANAVADIDQASAIDGRYGKRAVHAYRPEPVDRQEIRQLLDAAVHAPTAMHLEPWAFVVIEDRALLRRLSDRAKSMARLAASQTFVMSSVMSSTAASGERHLALIADPDFNIFYDAGTLIVICAKAVGREVAVDCWRAGENLMLAACALSLGTCRIDAALWALREPDVKDELGIPDGIDPVEAIVVGHPRSAAPPVSANAPEILRWSVERTPAVASLASCRGS